MTRGLISHVLVLFLVAVAVATPEKARAGVVQHPAGCPGRAFCGCGVSVRVFGHPVRELFLAANWYRFPRAIARAGMVAIFGRHHVAYIESTDGSGTATVYDPNSGGHATRIHTRDISHATIVNPAGVVEYSARQIHRQRRGRRGGKTPT